MPDARVIIAVACGAAIGGVLRLLITQLVVARFGPTAASYATLFINVSGSFAIGLVIESLQLRTGTAPLWRPFLAIGVLGGYTTFSTFSYEILSLSGAFSPAIAALYVFGSVGLGIAGTLAGVATARAMVSA